MNFVTLCNRIISASFYLLFFLVPLVFAGDTSELFEFNKMWLTFGLAGIIGFAWSAKMVLQKKLFIQRTPLDIPLMLFLASQIIASIVSLDSYVSFWGYYSRFNGGLLSTITYILLYYAFVTNLERKHIFRVLSVSLASGLFVALWGLPSHFGFDPTCYVFRGNFDVSCWTEAFQPKIRIFSTMGQPDWMAAYLDVLIPISIAFGLKSVNFFTAAAQIKNQIRLNRIQKSKIKNFLFTKHFLLSLYYLLLTVLFYLDLLYTRARSGFVAVAIALIFFFAYYLVINKNDWSLRPKRILLKYWYVLVVLICIGSITFFVGTPMSQLDKFTLAGIKNALTKQTSPTKPTSTSAAPAGEFGGTDSGKIRSIVWRGAIEIWKHNPLFGTGVETFAFAYYKYRPAEHNLTSEWDYLYNKAHNEYLNYLATTGLFGLGSYLSFIGIFLFLSFKQFKMQNSKFKITIQNAKSGNDILNTKYLMLNTSLIASFISILISNFFGFSVVIINLYLFLIPAFIFVLHQMLSANNAIIFPKTTYTAQKKTEFLAWQMLMICTLFVAMIFALMTFYTYWQADKNYALGNNYDHIRYYQVAHPLLTQAVEEKPQEPVFTDELSANDAALAANFAAQKDATNAAKFAKEAIQMSQQTIESHPNNVVYWKTRVRVFYTLGQIDPQYLPFALQAIQKASQLAPTDAKIWYNLGLLYSQNGDIPKGIAVMQKTTQLKPDYHDAYYALGLFYHQAAIDKDGKVINKDLEQKAVNTMQYILDHFSKDDKQVKDALKSWGEQ